MEEFVDTVWLQGQKMYRDMPWRSDTRPYYVLVSELMLQQTQVGRVIPKFEEFIREFPNENTLAAAPLADILVLWQGLGYNRRAKFLHEAAKQIVDTHNGVFPHERSELMTLPGVGKNTAGAIQAYAFNEPALFIETNIRTVYIHHFFRDDYSVSDTAIEEKLLQTIDIEHPREFYWALMDYGSHLKASGVRNIGRSRHYKKQSPLEGSLRQMRGRIIRGLSEGLTTNSELQDVVAADSRYEPALASLLKDGLITVDGHRIHLTK
ncbi:MAG: A/G-specific adenine glycosylase [Patescibacteria group bacterium]|nr:A/G-specific adenine glycosylase [Patescibacteria group bacterium]